MMNLKYIPKLITLSLVGAGLIFLLTNCASTGGGGLPPASNNNPFVNSLGMKFVPVPGTKILMCTTETTVSQYKAMGKGYKYPKFPQDGNHPAISMTWKEAKAWCKWMSQKEGRRYRLPTGAEWSAAVGNTKYPWGNQWPPPNNIANYAGQELRDCTPAERARLFWRGYEIIGGFSDRHKFTAPVGSYPPNRLGIYDLGGNVEEWGDDWYEYLLIRPFRGGSAFDASKITLDSSSSEGDGFVPFSMDSHYSIGFRCVIE